MGEDGKTEGLGERLGRHLHELPKAVDFASGLPPKINPISGVMSITPLYERYTRPPLLSLEHISHGALPNLAIDHGKSLGAILDSSMRIQAHVFSAGIVVDTICAVAYPDGINGRRKARLRLDAAIDHCLGLSGRYEIVGGGTYGND